MTNETQFFRKIYLSHFIRNGTKGLCVRGELETEQNCNILTPSSSGYSSTSFSSCFELQQLTPNSVSKLTRTSCNTRLYNCLTPTCFSERRIQPVHSQGYPLISSTGCTCYLHKCISYLTARPGWRSICYKSSLLIARTGIVYPQPIV